jgi:hypothetical protein
VKRLPLFTWNVSTLLFLVAISICVAIVSSCSSNAVSSGSNNQQDKLDWLNKFFTEGGPDLGPTLGECPVLFDTVLTQWVDSRGEDFELKVGNEKISFSLPRYAVYWPVKLTIKVVKYQATFGNFWMLDCGPEGTRFAKPLEVAPNNAIVNSSVAVLFYYNPTSGQWEVQQIAPSSNPGLSIYHFSKYGIAD